MVMSGNICVKKTKVLAFAKCRFSHDATDTYCSLVMFMLEISTTGKSDEKCMFVHRHKVEKCISSTGCLNRLIVVHDL